jgi:hypothetical protein
LYDSLKTDYPVYYAQNMETMWVSFENQFAEKGMGGRENKGAKGHAFGRIEAGDSCVLLSVRGPGIIRRMWLTVNDRSPEILRDLRLKIYWDNMSFPAVSVPLGDFFCHGLSRMAIFENCFFSSPQGRSMNTIIPMPFRKSAKVILVNESDRILRNIFYDIDFTRIQTWDARMLYFHCYWNHENPTTLGRDYTILPEIKGKGRFLGVNVGVIADSIYHNTWWGEGEVKFYIDGDTDYPSLCGTGTEDYIGTGWEQSRFVNYYQGCPLSDPKNRMWTFYRFHVPDPVFFQRSCRVTLQQIGGSYYEDVLKLYRDSVPLIPVTVNLVEKGLLKLLELEMPLNMEAPDFPKGKHWVNFYRQDNVSSTAYFYLDQPTLKN